MCCVNGQVSIKTIQNEILDNKNQNKCREDLLNMFNDDAVTQNGKFIFKIVSVFQQRDTIGSHYVLVYRLFL